ncbi:hypothetical protein AB0K16_36585 [Nonomuraea jabiensis]|uniref:hypothetical protein n=1 Tax=Nonomuraea jabiensis TaxID=882448 RepID=UPI0034198A11
MSNTAHAPVLSARGLRKEFGKGEVLVRAVDGVDAITGDSGKATLPAPWQLIAMVLVTVAAVAALTAVPARLGGRRPVTATR